MTQQHPGYGKSKPGFGRRAGRRGQTLVEYVLILAYVGIFTIQAMESMSFTATKEYVITNCSLIVGQMQNRSKTDQLAAVLSYLTDPATWGNADPEKVAVAQAQIFAVMFNLINNE